MGISKIIPVFLLSLGNFMKKETKKTKKTEKKFNFERAHHIADLLGTFTQFMPSYNVDSGIIPCLSREFVFKNLLGFTDEEFLKNEELLFNEANTIIKAIAKNKEAFEHFSNELAETISTNTKASKKEKAN